MGREAHCVIASFLEEGNRAPSALQTFARVAEAPLAAWPHVYGLAGRQFVAACVRLYFHFFVPSEAWTFLGAEMGSSAAPLDLVFIHHSGATRADELKTSRVPKLTDRRRLDRQLSAELSTGVETFGERFTGVRVLFIGAPSASFFANRDGHRTPLREMEDE
jgi:hypothetical protein